MPQTDLQGILKKVSIDSDTQKQFLSALSALSKNDEGFRKQLLNTLDVGPNEDKMGKSNLNLEKTRMHYAFWLAVIGIGLSAVLVVVLFLTGMDSQQIGAIIAIFTGITGTLVGTFFGVQIGSAGREQERADRRYSERMATMAMAKLDPQLADQVMNEMKGQ